MVVMLVKFVKQGLNKPSLAFVVTLLSYDFNWLSYCRLAGEMYHIRMAKEQHYVCRNFKLLVADIWSSHF